MKNLIHTALNTWKTHYRVHVICICQNIRHLFSLEIYNININEISLKFNYAQNFYKIFIISIRADTVATSSNKMKLSHKKLVLFSAYIIESRNLARNAIC